MPAGRVIATADMTAGEAQPEMDPAAVRLQTLFAAIRRPGMGLADLIDVLAS
jgi:hypothetical protein